MQKGRKRLEKKRSPQRYNCPGLLGPKETVTDYVQNVRLLPALQDYGSGKPCSQWKLLQEGGYGGKLGMLVRYVPRNRE
jgi:hypothetical protein